MGDNTPTHRRHLEEGGTDMTDEAQHITILTALGWKDILSGSFGELYGNPPAGCLIDTDDSGRAEAPNPLRDLDFAESFATFLRKHGWLCETNNFLNQESWRCLFNRGNRLVEANKPTLALAICEAGIKALGLWKE